MIHRADLIFLHLGPYPNQPQLREKQATDSGAEVNYSS